MNRPIVVNLPGSLSFMSSVTQTVEGGTMLAWIAVILLVLWLLGFLAFHVTAGTIHILLVIAVILFIVHLVRGRGATV